MRTVAPVYTELDTAPAPVKSAGQTAYDELKHRGAVWLRTTTTAPGHRLYALDGTVPPAATEITAFGGWRKYVSSR